MLRRYRDLKACLRPERTVPPIGASSVLAVGRRRNASDKRDRWRTLKTATSSSAADASSRWAGSTYDTSVAVRLEPTMPPSVAPAAMKPKSRFPCSELKTSTISAQNTDTTNRLKMDVQMKKTRPTHMLCSAVDILNNTTNTRRFALKNR